MNRFFHGTQQRTLWIVVLGFALASCRHSASTRMAVSARTVELNASPIPSTLAALYSLDVDEHDVVLTQDVFFDAASACFADLVAAVDRVEELLVLRILESVTDAPLESFAPGDLAFVNECRDALCHAYEQQATSPCHPDVARFARLHRAPLATVTCFEHLRKLVDAMRQHWVDRECAVRIRNIVNRLARRHPPLRRELQSWHRLRLALCGQPPESALFGFREKGGPVQLVAPSCRVACPGGALASLRKTIVQAARSRPGTAGRCWAHCAAELERPALFRCLLGGYSIRVAVRRSFVSDELRECEGLFHGIRSLLAAVDRACFFSADRMTEAAEMVEAFFATPSQIHEALPRSIIGKAHELHEWCARSGIHGSFPASNVLLVDGGDPRPRMRLLLRCLDDLRALPQEPRNLTEVPHDSERFLGMLAAVHGFAGNGFLTLRVERTTRVVERGGVRILSGPSVLVEVRRGGKTYYEPRVVASLVR